MKYCVYTYVFPDGMTYVGLTRQGIVHRNCDHRAKKHGRYVSPVMRYAKKSGLPFPDIYILETGLTKEQAQRDEDIYVSALPSALKLNTGKTGVGVGSTGKPENGKYKTQEEKDAVKKKYDKAYQTKHSAKLKAYRKKYVEEHKSAIRIQQAEYRKIHKQEIKEEQKRYRELHPTVRDKATVRKLWKTYYEKNKEYLKYRQKVRYYTKKFIALTRIPLLPYIADT